VRPARGYFNEAKYWRRSKTKSTTPVLGDIPYEASSPITRNFGGVNFFPTHNYAKSRVDTRCLELMVTDVKPNAPAI